LPVLSLALSPPQLVVCGQYIVSYHKIMLRIYVVRHGQNQDNADGILNGHRDQPLTDIGITQAHETADKLYSIGIQFDKVYTSPLMRAYKTAEIITDTLRLPKPEIMPELIERNFGVMTGKKQSQVVELCSPDILKTDMITYFLNPEGAETFPQLLDRAKRALTHIVAQHAEGDLLLVTHGDFGKMIYASYYNLDWMSVLKMFHFGNSDLLELSAKTPPEQSHMHRAIQRNL
jgi:broad specificity phosphatase PhoE